MALLPNASEFEAMHVKASKIIAEAAVAIIQKRTREGRDIEGNSFKPYSAGYRDLKAGSGRSVNPVNLTASGDLLNLLRVLKVGKDQILIGWKREPHRDFRFESHGKTKAILDPRQGLIPRSSFTGPIQQNLSSKERRKAGLKTLTITATKLHLQRDGHESSIEDVVKGLQGKRKFFGLGPDDVKVLTALYQAEIVRLTREFVAKRTISS